MFFKASTIVALAATGAFAAPFERRDIGDIIVRLSGEGAGIWDATGFSPSAALQVVSAPGPFSQVQLLFSDKIKSEIPGIETRYRCALKDENGNRIITTRGQSIDFNFGDNNNPNAWNLKNGPFGNVVIDCDPSFQKINADAINTVRVSLSDEAEFGRQVTFDASQVTHSVSQVTGGAFRTVELTVGPGVDNQKLRCQLTGPDGNVILLNRGANTNKETFGDAGKGAWTLDVAGDGIADVSTVTCDPSFV